MPDIGERDKTIVKNFMDEGIERGQLENRLMLLAWLVRKDERDRLIGIVEPISARAADEMRMRCAG